MLNPCHLTPRQRRPTINYREPILIRHSWKSTATRVTPTLTMSNHRQKLTSIDTLLARRWEKQQRCKHSSLTVTQMFAATNGICVRSGWRWWVTVDGPSAFNLDTVLVLQSTVPNPAWGVTWCGWLPRGEVKPHHRPHLLHGEHSHSPCSFCSHSLLHSLLWLTLLASFLAAEQQSVPALQTQSFVQVTPCSHTIGRSCVGVSPLAVALWKWVGETFNSCTVTPDSMSIGAGH